ncbi:hypothetical protein NLX83_15570 [Allokutzneria sp. A3M-2-11 16]|uniref:hypothetical protein n=1 Tax=Allokutzneria sp. A3M-2-11 16 TaxID=2962043 RepID=UPI0020B7880A|nr:hypothetical protein [Allokutzneria sp. A3M-2-11 16]MCP3800686.1 hypothetical protein [Allokutzneria sp. A3M-2-11 16]
MSTIKVGCGCCGAAGSGHEDADRAGAGGGAPAGGVDFDLAVAQIAVSGADAVPAAVGAAQLDIRGRPGAQGKQHCPALAHPRGELAGLGGVDHGGAREGDQVQAVGELGDDLAELVPGRGTNAMRSTATPASAAASTLNPGSPTTAAQEPSAVAEASIANSNEVDPRSAMVAPRRSPGHGRTSRSSGRTGSVRPTNSSPDAVLTLARDTDVDLLTVCVGAWGSRAHPPRGRSADARTCVRLVS